MKINVINYWTKENFKDKLFVLLNISGIKTGIILSNKENHIIDIIIFNVGIEVIW